jgi:thiosulfate dehydrogenase (quinone) large subunit
MREDYETQTLEPPAPPRPRRERARPQLFPPVSPAMALFPLRLFLGGTFVYAGVQKLSDPGFLHAGAPTYIGTQLHGFAGGTPGGFILRTFALPHPELAGVAVALTEILIGLLVTAGLFTRIAAAGGLALNFLLFLTASWHTTPYFLGPDLVFSFAWLPFVLAGAEGQPALDNLIEKPSPAIARRTRLRVPDGGGAMPEPTATRRALLAEFAGAAVAIAGIAALAKGSYTAARTFSGGSSGGATQSAGGGGGTSGSSTSSAAGSGGGSALPRGAVKLGPGSRLPSGQAAAYSDPADGSPDILIRDSEGNLKAFSAVCTHAGCTVGYEGGVIVCPCHGGEYSAETGEVIAGPPPSGLAPKRVVEAGGQIYAVPS